MSTEKPTDAQMKPWEVRDQRIRDQYKIVSEALESLLEEIGLDLETKLVPAGEYDPDAFAGTPFEELLTIAVETDYSIEETTVAAGYDAVTRTESPILKQTQGPEISSKKVFFGSYFEDADVSISCTTEYATSEETAGAIAFELQQKARCATTGADPEAGRDGLNYHQRTEFWPQPGDIDLLELRDHLLSGISTDGQIGSDRKLVNYIRNLRRWYPDRYPDDLSDELLEPKDKYLDRRLEDATVSPLSTQLVVELLKDCDGVEHVSDDYVVLGTIAVEPTDSDEPYAMNERLRDYGYQQRRVEKTDRDGAWIRIVYEPSRDHREILGRLVAAGADPEAALHYWATTVIPADHDWSGTDKTGWLEESGTSYNTSAKAIKEIKSTIVGESYLRNFFEKPAPDSVRTVNR